MSLLSSRTPVTPRAARCAPASPADPSDEEQDYAPSEGELSDDQSDDEDSDADQLGRDAEDRRALSTMDSRQKYIEAVRLCVSNVLQFVEVRALFHSVHVMFAIPGVAAANEGPAIHEHFDEEGPNANSGLFLVFLQREDTPNAAVRPSTTTVAEYDKRRPKLVDLAKFIRFCVDVSLAEYPDLDESSLIMPDSFSTNICPELTLSTNELKYLEFLRQTHQGRARRVLCPVEFDSNCKKFMSALVAMSMRLARQRWHHGDLPPAVEDTQLWQELCRDLIHEPKKFERHLNEPARLLAPVPASVLATLHALRAPDVDEASSSSASNSGDSDHANDDTGCRILVAEPEDDADAADRQTLDTMTNGDALRETAHAYFLTALGHLVHLNGFGYQIIVSMTKEGRHLATTGARLLINSADAAPARETFGTLLSFQDASIGRRSALVPTGQYVDLYELLRYIVDNREGVYPAWGTNRDARGSFRTALLLTPEGKQLMYAVLQMRNTHSRKDGATPFLPELNTSSRSGQLLLGALLAAAIQLAHDRWAIGPPPSEGCLTNVWQELWRMLVLEPKPVQRRLLNPAKLQTRPTAAPSPAATISQPPRGAKPAARRPAARPRRSLPGAIITRVASPETL